MKKEVIKWLDSIIGEAIKSVYISVDEKVDYAASLPRIPYIRQKYIEALEESIKYIYLPYMANERLLADLFVELYAFKKPLKYRLRGKRKKQPRFESTDIINTNDILNYRDNIAILGEPGAGKTTFLRRIAYAICAEEDFKFFAKGTKYFPVFIECRGNRIRDAINNHEARLNTREFKAEQMRKNKRSDDYINRHLPLVPHPILIAIAEELNEYGFPYPENLTKRLLEKGNLILFVDGLDEALLKHRPIISNGLTYLKNHFPNNRTILTCRSAEADYLPQGFAVYEITPLSEKQKYRFVDLWFSSRKGEAVSFLEKVVTTHIWSISDRPLLLTLLCALYEAGGDLPKYKVDLYRECAELALRRWDAIRHVKRNSVFKDLSTNQRMDILSKVAAEMMLENDTQINRSSLLGRIRNAMEERTIEGSHRDMLDEFVGHTGLIQQVALNAYSFSHKSLQEFFAARYFSIADPSLPVSKLKNDSRWLVTAEMSACMVPDATPILMSITSHLKRVGVEGFMDLASAIELIHKNPVTISLKGREKLIARVRHNISGFSKLFIYVVVIDNGIVKNFPAAYFKKHPFQQEHINTKLTVLFYYKSEETKLTKNSLKAVGQAIGFIFRLLVHAQSLIVKLLEENKDSWFESLLMSALIHTDPCMKRSATERLLTTVGEDIFASIEFH
jgi:hypothetical protein